MLLSDENKKGEICRKRWRNYMDNGALVLAIANHKGGVGKTSTAVNLACAFASTHRQVLLIDLDPQGSATVSLLKERPSTIISSGNALIDNSSLFPCIRHYDLGRFDLIPASDDLTAFCVKMQNEDNKEYCLKKALINLKEIYDIIIIDCPPALNLLTINALCASDELIVPSTCEYFAVEGLGSLLRLFENLKSEAKSNVHLMGIVRTMYDREQSLAQQISKTLKENFATLIFTTIIPFTARISEAPSLGRPVILYDKSSIGAKAYLSLAGEILSKAPKLKLKEQRKQEQDRLEELNLSNDEIIEAQSAVIAFHAKKAARHVPQSSFTTKVYPKRHELNLGIDDLTESELEFVRKVQLMLA